MGGTPLGVWASLITILFYTSEAGAGEKEGGAGRKEECVVSRLFMDGLEDAK